MKNHGKVVSQSGFVERWLNKIINKLSEINLGPKILAIFDWLYHLILLLPIVLAVLLILLLPVFCAVLLSAFFLWACYKAVTFQDLLYAFPNRLSKSEIQGKNLNEIVAYSQNKLVASIAKKIGPEQAQKTHEVMSRFAEENVDELFELERVRLQDGTEMPCLINKDFDPAKQTVIIMHGNTGNIFDYAKSACKFKRLLDCNVILPEYVGYGLFAGSPSKFAIESTMQEACWSLIKKYQIDTKKITVFGYSLGSGPSLSLVKALNHPDIRVVNIAGMYTAYKSALRSYVSFKDGGIISSLADFFGWLAILGHYDWRPAEDASSIANKIILVHGTDDSLLVYDNFVKFSKDLCKNGNLELAVTVCGAGHKSIIYELFKRQLYELIFNLKIDNYIEKDIEEAPPSLPGGTFDHAIITTSSNIILSKFALESKKVFVYKVLSSQDGSIIDSRLSTKDIIELANVSKAYKFELVVDDKLNAMLLDRPPECVGQLKNEKLAHRA